MGGELRAFLGGYAKAELEARAYDRENEQLAQLRELEDERWRDRQIDRDAWDADIETDRREYEAGLLEAAQAHQVTLIDAQANREQKSNRDAIAARLPELDDEGLDRLMAMPFNYVMGMLDRGNTWVDNAWISDSDNRRTEVFDLFLNNKPSGMNETDFENSQALRELIFMFEHGGDPIAWMAENELTTIFETDENGTPTLTPINLVWESIDEPLGFEVLTSDENKIFNDTFWGMLSGKQGIPIWMDGAFLTSPDEDLDVYLRAEELLSNTSIHWQTILQKLGKASKPAAHAGRIMDETMEFYSEENSNKVNTLLQDILDGNDTFNDDEKFEVIVILESRRAWDNTLKIDEEINSIESTMDPAVLEAMGLSLENGGGQPESETPAAVVPGPEPAPAPEGVPVTTNLLGPDNGIVQVSVPGQRYRDFKLNDLGRRKMAEAYAAYHASRGIGRPDTASDLRLAIARKFGFKLGNTTHVVALTAIIAQYDPTPG